MDEMERTDNGDGARCDGSICIHGCKISCITQGLKRFDGVGKRSRSVSLYIDPEVQSLAACHVEDATGIMVSAVAIGNAVTEYVCRERTHFLVFVVTNGLTGFVLFNTDRICWM